MRNDRLQIAVERRHERAQLRRALCRCLSDNRKRVRTEKRRTVSEQVKEDCAQTVDISCGSKLGRGTFGLLRRNVAGRPEGREAPGQIAIRFQPFREPKVADQRLAVAVKEDVTGLQVAVKQALFVGKLDCTRHFRHQFDAFARVFAQRRSDVAQAPACSPFHTEIGQAVIALADFVDRQDVRVIETGCGLCFAAEPLEPFVTVRVVAQHSLQGNDPLRMALPRPINNTHAAAADLTENLVVTEPPFLVRQINLREHALKRLT